MIGLFAVFVPETLFYIKKIQMHPNAEHIPKCLPSVDASKEHLMCLNKALGFEMGMYKLKPLIRKLKMRMSLLGAYNGLLCPVGIVKLIPLPQMTSCDLQASEETTDFHVQYFKYTEQVALLDNLTLHRVPGDTGCEQN